MCLCIFGDNRLLHTKNIVLHLVTSRKSKAYKVEIYTVKAQWSCPGRFRF